MVRNGKIDRDALIVVADQVERASQEKRGGVKPEGDAELAVAEVYAKAAGIAVFDRDLSLSDLGADSLSAIEARIELEARGFDVPDNWEWMPISQLAGHYNRISSETEGAGWAGQMRRLDMFIVLRSVAIVLVVAHHTGWEFGIGASLVLLALAGYTFGRLHLPAILDDGRTGRVWALIAKLLIPLIPVSLLLYAVHTELGNSPHPATILLYENVAEFVDEVVLGVQNQDGHIIWLWFLHVYLQIFLVLGILLGIPRLRTWFASDPWRGALLFFIVAEIIGAGLILLLSGPMGQGDIGHVSSLLLRSPTTLLPFFTLGILFALADTSRRRIVAMLLGFMHFLLAQIIFANNQEVAWLVALVLCALVPYIVLPRMLTSVLVTISGHALMIYLSHRVVYFVIEGLAPAPLPVALAIVVQLAVGVLLGIGLRSTYDRLGVNRLANMQISFGAAAGTSVEEGTRVSR